MIDLDLKVKRLADTINNHIFLVAQITRDGPSLETTARHAWSMEALESAIHDALEEDDGITPELQDELDSLAEDR